MQVLKSLSGLVMVAMAVVLSSCSPNLSYFTQRLYEEGNFSKSELKRIQFYLSDDIVMRRQLSASRSEVVSGEIKIIDGRKYEQIVIRRGTPGIALFMPKENRLAVSFEDRKDDRYLVFGPSPKANNRYVLLASEWNRRRGAVTYDGRRYEVSANDAIAGLMVDLKKVRNSSVKSRVARGRTVD